MRLARATARLAVALARLRVETWRLRRVNAGIERAIARHDPAALARWIARGHRACDDLEPALVRVRAERRR